MAKVFGLTEQQSRRLGAMLEAYESGELSATLGSGRSANLPGETSVFGKLQTSMAAVASSGGTPMSATLDIYKFTSTGGTTQTTDSAVIYNLTPNTATTVGWVMAKRDSRGGKFMMQGFAAGPAGHNFLVADLTTQLDPGTTPYPKVDNIRDSAGTTQAAISTSQLRNPYNLAGRNNDEVQLLEWGTQATTTGGTEPLYNVVNIENHIQTFIFDLRVTTGTTNVLEGGRLVSSYGMSILGSTWVEIDTVKSCSQA